MLRFTLLVCPFLAVAVSCADRSQPVRTIPDNATGAPATKEYISGPFRHENLAIYLVHGEDELDGRHFVTLQEALEQKRLVVHETGNVQELAVENVSTDDVIYIQAGEIVRGGKQDRVIRSDMLVSPNSGKVPIAAFCVESGRWSQRGGESVARFSASANSISSNSLKLAVRYESDQSAVWRAVDYNLHGIAANLGTDVLSDESATSLELTLDNEKIKKSAAEYTGRLAHIVQQANDAVGYVAVINGKISSADVYGSRQLFRKLWPKMLNASAVEAIAEADPKANFTTPDIAEVESFLADVQRAEAKKRDLSARVTAVTRETEDHVLYETVDRQAGSARVHGNYLNKKFKE
ncbi:MAG: hypothetical protein O7B26_10550 [Planctomycetota bacterium]|nr:hypothetical protein [Planctomycetota bacterium]